MHIIVTRGVSNADGRHTRKPHAGLRIKAWFFTNKALGRLAVRNPGTTMVAQGRAGSSSGGYVGAAGHRAGRSRNVRKTVALCGRWQRYKARPSSRWLPLDSGSTAVVGQSGRAAMRGGMGLAAAASIVPEEVTLASLVEELGISLAHLALGNRVIECRLPRHIPQQHAIFKRRGEPVNAATGAGILCMAQRMTTAVLVAFLVVLVARVVVLDGRASGVRSIRVEVESLAGWAPLRRRRMEACYMALVSRGDVV